MCGSIPALNRPCERLRQTLGEHASTYSYNLRIFGNELWIKPHNVDAVGMPDAGLADNRSDDFY
jgi:hypothetical protein